jgi:DNA-binding NarL/FixJ family response regulator
MKIAYLEDDENLRTLYIDRFAQARYTCDAFTNAEDLLKAAAPGKFDLLLLDIRLPGMSGVQLLKALRQRGIFTPAILMTAFNNVEYAREALNASANYLLEKPFSFSQLKRLAEKVVSTPTSLHDCVDRGLARLRLAKREEEVARLLLKGLSNKDIADIAHITEPTVKQYLVQLFQKAGVRSRTEFFSYIFPV